MSRAVAAVLTACACARGVPAPAVPPSVLENEQVRQVVVAALAAEAEQRDADSLYVIGATAVVEGRSRSLPPRYAGIRPDGRVQVTAVTLELTPYLAWATAEYRWIAATGDAVTPGRATFVLERMAGSWRIKHAHSSSPATAGLGRPDP